MIYPELVLGGNAVTYDKVGVMTAEVYSWDSPPFA